MTFKWKYKTPDGFSDMIMNSDGEYLTALCFEGSMDENKIINSCKQKDLKIFRETCEWLDIYFSGKTPNFTPKYKIKNITSFRQEVQDIMVKIPYGKTTTYNDIAKLIAKNRNKEKMSAQAVGGAVGANPICIIVPCHRVIGSNGSLVGYGGGIENKVSLLKLESENLEEKNYD